MVVRDCSIRTTIVSFFQPDFFLSSTSLSLCNYPASRCRASLPDCGWLKSCSCGLCPVFFSKPEAATILCCRSHGERANSCASKSSHNSQADTGPHTYAADLRMIKILAHSGKFHSGQIVMTDFAFTWYQDLQLTVTEVIDHGLHRVIAHGTYLCFKELLPACLPGRESSAFNYSPDVVQLSNGFHDAPALPGPMCICFCNVAMPQVRSCCC